MGNTKTAINPFSASLQLLTEDVLSSVDNIQSTDTFEIPVRRQMIVQDALVIDGTLNIKGTLVIKGITGDENVLGNLSITGATILSVGTTTQAPLNFPDATALKTTPASGDMEYKDGHLYIMNGARHVITTGAGVKDTTTTVVNTVTETTVYSYTFAANELHVDERIIFTMDGIYSNASASDDWVLKFYMGGTLQSTLSRSGGNVTNAGWEAQYKATVRSVGASGTFVDFIKLTDGTNTYASGSTTPTVIDTTDTILFEVKLTWANAKAGNTFSCTQADLSFIH